MTLDEFCILLPNCTMEEVKESLIEFTKTPKHFRIKGKHILFVSHLVMPNIQIMRLKDLNSCVVPTQLFMK